MDGTDVEWAEINRSVREAAGRARAEQKRREEARRGHPRQYRLAAGAMAAGVTVAAAADYAQVFQIVSGAMSQPGPASTSVHWRRAGGVLMLGYADSMDDSPFSYPISAGGGFIPAAVTGTAPSSTARVPLPPIWRGYDGS